MDTYTYQIGENLYINLTNRCSNACTFCVRNEKASYYGNYLWLKDGEPSAQTVIGEIGDPKRYKEVVFCGFGEPTCRLDAMLEIAAYVKAHGGTTRLNTNGQGSLIAGRDIVPLLLGKIDRVNVSLNNATKARYEEVCKPKFAEGYEAMLRFGQDCVKAGLDAWFSVVDVIGAEEVEACRRLAKELGVPLRVREMITDS